MLDDLTRHRLGQSFTGTDWRFRWWAGKASTARERSAERWGGLKKVAVISVRKIMEEGSGAGFRRVRRSIHMDKMAFGDARLAVIGGKMPTS
jgi:hypothetical protein